MQAQKNFPGGQKRRLRPKHSGPNTSGPAGKKQHGSYCKLQHAAPGGSAQPGPSTSTGSAPTAQPGTVTVAESPEKRLVATWTYHSGTEAPVSYFSAAPWKRQEWSHSGKKADRLLARFQGWTVADEDLRANGASLPPAPGSVFCICGGLLLADSHSKSKLHRGRIDRQEKRAAGATAAPASQLSAAVKEVMRQVGQNPAYAQWLLAAARAGPEQSALLLFNLDDGEVTEEATSCSVPGRPSPAGPPQSQLSPTAPAWTPSSASTASSAEPLMDFGDVMAE
ncbi:hypothetical protein V5799_014463 [Amblyomma americanum]|uniref:Uncharacterized protein n=1 Tax=Amblyomma americanum TaxID=6943 RepID=A0AAQ4E2Y7_AMBAM